MKYSIVILDNFIPFTGNYEFKKINPIQAKKLLKNFKFMNISTSPGLKVIGLLPSKNKKRIKISNNIIQMWIKEKRKEIRKDYSIKSHYKIDYIISIAIPHISKIREKIYEILQEDLSREEQQ